MYYGLLDETLSRTLKRIGIEYALTMHSRSQWDIQSSGSDTTVRLGKLEVIVSKVCMKAEAAC